MPEFNPHDWLPENRKNQKGKNTNFLPTPTPTGQNVAAVESALQALEAAGSDITSPYSQWLELGFALASEFGEGGREYFHRLSRFHPEYNHKECDEKYSSCLKSKGGGIGIGTFFHHLKSAGILIQGERPAQPSPKMEQRPPAPSIPGTPPLSGGDSPGAGNFSEEEPEETSEEPMPVFPDILYESLPHFLQRVVAPATSPEERDLLLLGSLAAMSACFPTLYGIYHGRKVYPNLYLFVTAPASAGKGRLSLCKQLVLPIHYKKREQSKMLKLQYTNELAAYNQSEKESEKPGKPPERMLFIPANNSSTGVFQLLADNEGRGLIFETEGDTLAQSFKTDYGNYSDGFRKAYQHETISYYRRTDREYVDIESPCLSTVLSGTSKQVTALIPSAENGLFSRFLFYYMNLKPEFQDVFANDDHDGMDDHFWQLGLEFLELHQTLLNHPPMRVILTQAQKARFLHTFSAIQDRYLHVQPEEYVATVRRMGLNAFRLAMILVALRTLEDGEVTEERVCTNLDFENVMIMVKVLIKHSSRVFNSLPEEVKLTRRENLKEKFLESLPLEFTTQDYFRLALELKIPERTAERYVAQFVKKKLLQKKSVGNYLNPAKLPEGGEIAANPGNPPEEE